MGTVSANFEINEAYRLLFSFLAHQGGFDIKLTLNENTIIHELTHQFIYEHTGKLESVFYQMLAKYNDSLQEENEPEAIEVARFAVPYCNFSEVSSYLLKESSNSPSCLKLTEDCNTLKEQFKSLLTKLCQNEKYLAILQKLTGCTIPSAIIAALAKAETPPRLDVNSPYRH